jgi:hypothetical protein
MLDAATAQHSQDLVSLVLSGLPDCTLVSSLAGGQVEDTGSSLPP